MYVNPKDAAKVQARKAAAYGKAPKKVVAPKKAQGAAAMAQIAKAGK